MPGILPSSASFRSMMRLILNFRYTPLARPVSSHRRTSLDEYFGVFLLLTTCAFVAMPAIRSRPRAHAGFFQFRQLFVSGFLKGIPSSSSTKRLISGSEFEKVRLMFMPWVKFTSAMLISGNTPCSLRPIE